MSKVSSGNPVREGRFWAEDLRSAFVTLTDSKRAQVGKAQTYYESEMALLLACILKCARKLLDTADIVRDGKLRQRRGTLHQRTATYIQRL